MLILEFFDDDYENIMEFYRRNILVDDRVFFCGKDCILPSELTGSIFSEERIIYYDFEDKFVHSTLLDNGFVQSSNYLLFFSWFKAEKLNLSFEEVCILKIISTNEYKGYKIDDFLKFSYNDSDGTVLFVWMYPSNQFMINEEELDNITLQPYLDFHFRILGQLGQVILNFVKRQVQGIEFMRLDTTHWSGSEKILIKDINATEYQSGFQNDFHEPSKVDQIQYGNRLSSEINSFFTHKFRI